MATRTQTADAKPRTPVLASQVSGATHPALDAMPPYLFVFHPDRWIVMAGQLVPALERFPLAAGVNRVEFDKDGRVKLAAARAAIEERGRRFIPWEDAPDGVSYLRCVDTRPGGGPNVVETWISVWEEVGIGARETDADEEGYAKWLTDMITSGKLPKCPLGTANRMLDKARERLERTLADLSKNGGHGAGQARARLIGEEVKVLEEVVASYKAERTERAKPKDKRQPQMDGAA